MEKKKIKLSDIILPHKKINYFVITILVLGLISGSIFITTLNESDKAATITQITTLITNIDTNKIDNGLALKNSLITNYIFVLLIWFLGLSIIGVAVNIFITYLKGFIVGFSISSIIVTYQYKAIPAALLYIFPAQVLNIIVVSILTIYSIMFSKSLLKVITSKKPLNNRRMLKKYLVILAITIVLSFISSLSEVYLFPNLLKIIISLYTK